MDPLRPTVRPSRLAVARASALAVAALTLVACGSGESDQPAPAPAATTSAPAPAPTESAAPSAAPSSTASTGSTVEDNAEAVTAAANTAVREVSGAVVVSIESDDEDGERVWQVQVVTTSNDEQELDVSADGSEVVRTERVDRQDDRDRRENRALLNAMELEVPNVVQALPDSVAGGSVESLEVDPEGSRPVWEADVRAPDGREHEIRIDGASGELISDRT